MEKVKNPIINIITRVSRPNYFKKCYNSIHNQIYGNFNHIVTYETPEMFDFLQPFVEKGRIKLVKVPNKKRIKGLTVSWNHSPQTDKYLNPEHTFLDYRYLHEGEDSSNNRFVKIKHPVNVEVYKCELKNNLPHFYSTPDKTWREYAVHAPYNWYLKIAERELEDGWVMYVDDDDTLLNKDSLQKIKEEILKHDEDTLHIFPLVYPNGDEIPDKNRRKVYRVGFPFVHKQVSGVCLCFSTKYIDYTYWDEWSSADYRTATSLREAIPNLNVTDIITVKLQSGTNGGFLDDIK